MEPANGTETGWKMDLCTRSYPRLHVCPTNSLYMSCAFCESNLRRCLTLGRSPSPEGEKKVIIASFKLPVFHCFQYAITAGRRSHMRRHQVDRSRVDMRRAVLNHYNNVLCQSVPAGCCEQQTVSIICLANALTSSHACPLDRHAVQERTSRYWPSGGKITRAY